MTKHSASSAPQQPQQPQRPRLEGPQPNRPSPMRLEKRDISYRARPGLAVEVRRLMANPDYVDEARQVSELMQELCGWSSTSLGVDGPTFPLNLHGRL